MVLQYKWNEFPLLFYSSVSIAPSCLQLAGQNLERTIRRLEIEVANEMDAAEVLLFTRYFSLSLPVCCVVCHP